MMHGRKITEVKLVAVSTIAAVFVIWCLLVGCTVTHIHRFEFDAPKSATTQAATPFQGFVEQLSDERIEK